MKMEPVEEYRERSLREEYLRHNQELRKIRKFIRNKGASNVFEKKYLASGEQFLERAQYAVKLLDETDYDDPVSYTHLDVYKRQRQDCTGADQGCRRLCGSTQCQHFRQTQSDYCTACRLSLIHI